MAGYETFFSMTVAHLMHRLAEFDPDAVVSLRMEHGKQVWYKHVRQVRRHASEPGYPPRPDDPILCVSSYSIGVECDRCRGVVVDEAPGLFDE